MAFIWGDHPIFQSDDWGVVAAHEVGHGMFELGHSDGDPTLPTSSLGYGKGYDDVDNLMKSDATKTKLRHWQWEEIRNNVSDY